MMETISPDKAFYDAEPMGSLDDHAHFMAEIDGYFSVYADRLNAALAGTEGRVVELGAGSCGLSCCVSRLANVRQVQSADISAARMEKMLGRSFEILGGDRSKIETTACDFNLRLPFDNHAVDAVLFDAALHHTRSMWNLLGECARIVRPGGVLVAQRESYLSGLRAGKQIAALLSTPEVSASVSENMYLKAQYEYYLKVSGFSVEFIPYARSPIKRGLRVLNGSLFTDGVLFCRSKQQ